MAWGKRTSDGNGKSRTVPSKPSGSRVKSSKFPIVPRDRFKADVGRTSARTRPLLSASFFAESHQNSQHVPEQQHHRCEQGKRGGDVLVGAIVVQHVRGIVQNV